MNQRRHVSTAVMPPGESGRQYAFKAAGELVFSRAISGCGAFARVSPLFDSPYRGFELTANTFPSEE